MKRIWTLLFLLASTAVFLMACRDNQAAEAVVPTEPPGQAVEATATLPTTTNSLNQIGNSKQPQFLNAYASW